MMDKATEAILMVLHAIIWGICIGFGFWIARKITDWLEAKVTEKRAEKEAAPLAQQLIQEIEKQCV